MKKFSDLFRAGVRLAVVLLLGGGMLYGQNVGSLQGQVTDPKGLAVGNVTIEVTESGTGASRTTSTDSNGSYSLSQIRPGNYTVTFSRDGFRKVVRENVAVLVSTPTTLNVQLALGEVTETVTVEATLVPALNTTDATVGNTFSESEVKTLPFLARNAVNLLTLQPGVVFTGQSDTDKLSQGSIRNLDAREGAVNGVRGNQSNVTVDGVDVNDWQNQAAFTSALPVTLDSLQEFRVTTTSANATDGGAGGAQVALVTKSGTNDFHGNARWFYRTSGATANNFFNNQAGVARPKLQRNIGGGSLGGRAIRDRVFFFLDFEGRRDASSEGVSPRQVASDALRDGVLVYACQTPGNCPGGSVQGINGPHTVAPGFFGLTPAQTKQVDTAGLGVNAAMIQYMKIFPAGNDPSAGLDGGLTLTGFRFNAPILLFNNIYTAKLDFNITRDGRHTAFWRGTLGGIKNDLVAAQFPGQSASSVLLNNSRGSVASYTAQLKPTLINTFRWGFTRLGVNESGASGAQFGVRDFSDVLNFRIRGARRAVPVHEFKDDVSWSRGSHTIQFGGAFRRVRNSRVDDALTFPLFFINNGFCQRLCQDAVNNLPANGLPAAADVGAFTRAYMMLVGPITQVSASFLSNPVTQQFLPSGTPESRRFAENDYELYAQDTWRLKPNFSVTIGLHYMYATPPWETHGFQVRPTISIHDWFAQREINQEKGIPSDASPLLSFDVAGRAVNRPSWYRPDRKNFAPRLSLAWSPGYNDGILKHIFGGSGKSSIRAGAGLYFARMGQAIAVDSDLNGSPGASTTLIDNSQAFSLATAPRFNGTCTATGCTGLPPLTLYFTPPTSAKLPFTPPSDTSGLGFVVDDRLKTPYSMNFTLSFQRQLPKSVVVDVSYVGTFGRRLVGKQDYAQYLNLRDPKSGQTLFQAYQQIVKLAGNSSIPFKPLIDPTDNVALAAIKDIPYFTNLMPNMPQTLAFVNDDPSLTSLTPTQAFYAFVMENSAPSWSCPLFFLDTFGFPSPWNTTVDPQRDGFVLFTPQWSTLPGWANVGNSNFHSLQIGVRKNAGLVVFGANYVFSKSIDNTSGAENGDLNPNTNGTLAGLIQNPFDLRAGRGVSDFDLRHNFNAFWVVDLPFGRGRKFASGANRAIDAIIGGWQVNGVLRWHSGFPAGPGNGFNFPTNFFLTTPGTLNALVSSSVTRNGASGRPNLFQDPAAVKKLISFTLPGLSGSRNVFRLAAYASTDMGVYKSIRMPWSEKERIQFRVTAFNVFNSVNFGDGGSGELGVVLNPTRRTFGRFRSTAGPRGGAREMEFAIRFEF